MVCFFTRKSCQMAQKCWKKINLWRNWFFKSIVLFRWFLSSGSTRKDHKTIQDKILSRFYLKESIVSKNERKFKRRSKQFGNGLKKGQLESIWWQKKIPKNSKTPNLNTHIEFIYFYRPSLIAVKWNSNTSIGWHVNIFCMHVVFFSRTVKSLHISIGQMAFYMSD